MKHSHGCPIVIFMPILLSTTCARSRPPALTITTSSSPTNSEAAPIPAAVPGVLLHCTLPSVSVSNAAAIPGSAELDPSIRLHYTGNGKVIIIGLKTYRLEINGMVDYPLNLSYDNLRCQSKIEVQTTIACKRNFDDTAVWAGGSLK